MTATREQRKALHRLYMRTVEHIPMKFRDSYLRFRRTADFNHLMGCIMVPFAGMWIGIEKDGYTHS